MNVNPNINIFLLECLLQKFLIALYLILIFLSRANIISFPNIEKPLIPAPRAEKKFLFSILESVSIIINGNLLFPNTLETIFVKTFVWLVAVVLSRNILDKLLRPLKRKTYDVFIWYIVYLVLSIAKKRLEVYSRIK